jgi:hypothetical protein
MRRTLGLISIAIMLVLTVANCSKQLPTQLPKHTTSTGALTAQGPLSIGDFVWNDLNGNGIQDSGEPGIPGIAVYLTNENNDFIKEVLTDGAGHYLLADLEPGIYHVGTKATCPPTKVHAGSDPSRDSESDPTTVDLTADDHTIDFGVIQCPGGPGGDCGKCKDKVTSLTLRFTGSSDADVRITQKGSNHDVFNSHVGAGESFNIVGQDKKGTLGDEIKIYVNGVLNTKIHTSCSKPIGPGLVSGSFEVTGGSSLKGGPLCPVPPPPGGDGDLCENGRPRALTFTYTGEDCSASHHAQAAGKVVCTGDPAFASPVHITITDSSTPGSGNVYFDGDVSVNGQLTEDAANFGGTKVPTNSYAYIYSGGVLVQKIQYHTSCSQPLRVGDQFGSLHLDGFANNLTTTDLKQYQP